MPDHDPAIAKMEANIAENTGRPVAEWIGVVKQSGLHKHGEIVKFLKTDHGFTHGYANLVAHQALQSSAAHHDDEDLVAAQYAGEKAALKPVYDAIVKAVNSFGADVEIAPKKTYVSLRRKKQFALVQPSTATRLDVGLNLKGIAPSGRLESADGFNAMCTHRVRVESAGAVDAELVGWLRRAYEAAG
jgi:predicted transport protein